MTDLKYLVITVVLLLMGSRTDIMAADDTKGKLLSDVADICVSGNHETEDINKLREAASIFGIQALDKLAEMFENKVLDCGDKQAISATSALLDYAESQYGSDAKETIRCRRCLIIACVSTDWGRSYELSRKNKEQSVDLYKKNKKELDLLQLKLLCHAEYLAVSLMRETDNPEMWKQMVDIEKDAEPLLGKGMADNAELVALCNYMANMKMNETIYPTYVNYLIQRYFPRGTYLVGRSYDNDVYSTAESFMMMALEGGRSLWGEQDLRRIRIELQYIGLQIRYRLTDFETLHQQIVDIQNYVTSYLPEGDILPIDTELLKWECDLVYEQNTYEIRNPFPLLLKIGKYYGAESERYLDYAHRCLYIQSQLNLSTADLLANDIARLEEQLFLTSAPDIYGVHLLNLFTLRQGQALEDPKIIQDYMEELSNFYLQHHHPSWQSVYLGRYIAYLYSQAFQQPDKGDTLLKQALEDTKLLAGDKSPIYAFSLSEYVRNSSLIDNHSVMAEAESRCKETIELFNELGLSTSELYRTLSSIQIGLGKYEESANSLRTGIAHSTKPEDYLWQCMLRLVLGKELLSRAKPMTSNEVESLFEEGIRTFNEYEEQFDGGFMECYLCIGFYFTTIKKYQEAVQIYRRGLERYKQLYIDVDWIFNQLVHDLYALYTFTLNDINQGELLLKEYEESIGGSANTFSAASLELDILWNRYYTIKANRPDDLPLRSSAFTDVVNIIEKMAKLAGGDLSDHQELALPLIFELGEMCAFLGEKEKIVDLAKTSEEKNMAVSFMELSAQYKKLCREMLKPTCEGRLEQLKSHDSDWLSRDETRMLYYTLANYYLGVERDTLQAEECYRVIAASPSNSIRSNALRELAMLKYQEGMYEETANLLELSGEEILNNAWTSNETRSFYYNELYSSYYRIGKWREAIKPAMAYFQLRQQLIAQNFDLLTQSERESFVSQGGAGSDGIELLVAKFPQELSGDAYDAVLAEKGLLLRASERIKKAIVSSSDISLSNLVDSLNLLKGTYKTMSAQPNLSKGDYNFDTLFVSTKRKIERLEREINRRARQYVGNSDSPTWSQVQRELKPDEAAIEFIFSDSITGALVMLPQGQPRYVPLTNSYFLCKQLDELNQYSMKKVVTLLYEKDVLKLYDRLWKPLEGELHGITTVYFSPSGYLNQFAFHAFKCDDGSCLSDRYELHQMLSTGNMVRKEHDLAPIKSASLYGAVCYSSSQVAFTKQANYASSSIDDQRGAIVDEDEAFGYLPFTLEEVEDVERSLRSRHIETDVFIALDATEHNFRKISKRSPDVIHLSTHGFFLYDDEQVLENKFLARFPSTRYNSLQRCGLAMERANLTWTGLNDRIEENDGILTANEVAQLDLDKTRLAVLSACRTAFGHYSRDGVYGIHRGFKQAGVKSILASLWNVNDKSTARLMELFYEKWLSGIPMQQSLNKAVSELRNEYPSPFYWAPFVLLDAEN